MATLEQVKAAVRMLAGDPDSTTLVNTALERFITEQALEWLNKRRPGKALSSFTTVYGQQDYAVKPSNAYRITDVFWMSGGYDVFSPSLRFLPSSMDMDKSMSGFNTVDNPALVETFYKHVEQYKQNFKGNGWETEQGKIRLEPYPGEDGDTVYFFYTYPIYTTVASVPDHMIEGLKNKAAALVCEYLAIKRGRVRGGRNFSGGGGERETEAAERMHARADEIVPALYNPFGRG